MPHKIIKIFIATSANIVAEKNTIVEFMYAENARLEKQGIQVNIIQQANEGNFIPGPESDREFEKLIRECDIILFLLSMQAGGFPSRELDIALKVSGANQIPKIWTFVKQAEKVSSATSVDSREVLSLAEKLLSAGRFYYVYTGLDTLKEKFRSQFMEFNVRPLSPRSAAAPKKSKNILKSFVRAINPFAKSMKKSKTDQGDVRETFSANDFERFSGAEAMSGFEPESQPSPAPAATPPPQNRSLLVEPLEQKPPKGKVLYDIPDNMFMNKQHKCIVRIGENEAIIRDDDSFSGAEKIESITISGVMKVDLVDISEPPRFLIKTINSSEQEVEGGSYTEWLFWVTPLTNGLFALILKISAIKMVNGKETRKELVFEKPVTISAETEPATSTAMQSLMRTPQNAPTEISPITPVLKDLSNEKNVVDLDPPVAFISYAHKDKTYFDIFMDYFQTQSGWTIWTDRNIEIGSDWYDGIEKSIAKTDIAVLLISAHFISSAFIKEHEFKKFSVLKTGKPGFTFMPILLRDVDFTRWEELSAMQLFVAYGDEYGVPEKKGQMIPFAKLCRFDNNSQLILNDNLDTYFKNLIKKAEKDWLKTRLKSA